MNKIFLYFWSTVELHINNIIKRYFINRLVLHLCGENRKKALKETLQMDSILIKITTNTIEIIIRVNRFNWKQVEKDIFWVIQTPDKLCPRITASKPFLWFPPFHRITQNSNGNGNKMKIKWTGGWASQSFQVILVDWSRPAGQHLRNWEATGEPLMVFVFNIGGVSSPLIKRETKEPNNSSGTI